MKRILILAAIVMMSMPYGFAAADADATRFATGEWSLADSSSDTSPVTTTDTQSVVLNPMNHAQLTNEATGSRFVCTSAAAKTEGAMDSIGFRVSHNGPIDSENVSRADHQVHFVSYNEGMADSTGAEPTPVPLTGSASKKIGDIHDQCLTFCDANTAGGFSGLTQ